MLDPDRMTRVDTRLRQAIESGRMPKELCVCGPAGSGKTFGVLAILHMIASGYQNIRILVARQTRVSLTQSALVTMEDEILRRAGMEAVASGVTRRGRASYKYPSGSEIVLAGLEEPGRVMSTSFDVCYLNEAIEVSEESYEAVLSRLDRPGRPRGLGWMILDTNPGDPSHWLRARLDRGQTVLWDVPHEANPELHDGRDWTEAGRSYLGRLDGLTGTRRKRLRDGLWCSGPGAWFGDSFDPAKHVGPVVVDDRYPVGLSVDTGVHCAACLWQLVGPEDGPTLNVIADYYAYDVHAYENAKAILRMVAEHSRGRFDVGRYDPAGGAKSGFGGQTIASEFQRAGLHLHPWIRFEGCEVAGLNLLESFIAVDPPKFRVAPHCTRLIDALTNFRRKKRGGSYIDESEPDQHPHEDCMDALRSGLLDRWPGGRAPEPKLRRVPVRSVFH